MIPDEIPEGVSLENVRRIRENAIHEPSEACARCGKEGGWVLMKSLPGRYHVRCAVYAEFLRKMAERNQAMDRISYKTHRKLDRYAAKMSRLFGRE